jgi:hypothetical protein
LEEFYCKEKKSGVIAKKGYRHKAELFACFKIGYIHICFSGDSIERRNKLLLLGRGKIVPEAIA